MIARTVTVRLLPEDIAQQTALNKLSGAARYVWNIFLRRIRDRQEYSRLSKIVTGNEYPPPDVSEDALHAEFDDLMLRGELKSVAMHDPSILKNELSELAEAWPRALRRGEYPKFRERKHPRAFALDSVDLMGDCLIVPGVGAVPMGMVDKELVGQPIRATVRRGKGQAFSARLECHPQLVTSVERSARFNRMSPVPAALAI